MSSVKCLNVYTLNTVEEKKQNVTPKAPPTSLL